MGGMFSCCKCCKGKMPGKPKKQCTDYSKGDDGFFACPGQAQCGRQTGSVWGTGPYTADSSICAAARHNGTIGEKGGFFKVSKRDGQDSYEGSEKNGVTTSSYGNYDSSFVIDKFF